MAEILAAKFLGVLSYPSIGRPDLVFGDREEDSWPHYSGRSYVGRLPEPSPCSLTFCLVQHLNELLVGWCAMFELLHCGISG